MSMYTVPTGQIARIDMANVTVRVATAPTTAGECFAVLKLITDEMGTLNINFGVAPIATIADSVSFSIQSPLWLYEGDRFQLQYNGAGVGGIINKYLSYIGTLFTA